jgi:putative DNA primase/helicase
VLDSPDLARALTQAEYADRLLGENKMLRLPTNVLWTATGNNLTFRGDLSSRTLLCRIDSGVERPEERKFTISNLAAHLVENRKSLVVAALTVLRAYHAAGRPACKEMKRWGGFDEWSDAIRAPLIWAGLADPYDTRANVLADDPELEMARSAFSVLQDAFGENEFLVRDVVDQCDKNKELRNVMLGLAARRNAKDQLDPRRLGSWFRRFRGRVLNNLRLLVGAGKPGGAIRWKVSEVSEVSQFPTDPSVYI